MARVNFGPVVSSISGSVGASTFRNGASGSVLYNHPFPSRRASDSQLQHRSFISASASAWSALDADIRRAWDSLAKQQAIPTYFSHGRRWRGRDLYTCFFLYAQHQLTPLPSRWLPTPPLFFSNYFFSALVGAPVPPANVETRVDFSTAYPLVLNAVFPDSFSFHGVSSIFFGYTKYLSRTPPRRFVKIAPLSPSMAVAFPDISSPPYGFSYSSWNNPIGLLLGPPPGLPFPTVSPVSPRFSCAYSAFTLTDDRLYYSGLLFGDPHIDPLDLLEKPWLVNNAIPSDTPTNDVSLPLDIPSSEY